MPAAAGGIKLHRELSFLLGGGTQLVLAAARACALAAWPLVAPCLCWGVAGLCAVGGLVPGLALLSDLLLLAGWPLLLLYVVMAGLYRLQLQYLQYTWKLMRGNFQVRCKSVANACGQCPCFQVW
jgi:hypothetical protein